MEKEAERVSEGGPVEMANTNTERHGTVDKTLHIRKKRTSQSAGSFARTKEAINAATIKRREIMGTQYCLGRTFCHVGFGSTGFFLGFFFKPVAAFSLAYHNNREGPTPRQFSSPT